MGILKDSFANFPQELLEDLRRIQYERESDAEFQGIMSSLFKATMALCEANVPEKEIISLLQKYWDLRLSEAEQLLAEAKEELDK